MKILGIDPGLCITGYGLIEAGPKGLKLIEAGIVRTSAKEKVEARIEKIYDGIKSLVRESKPDVLVLEQLYSHYKHPVTSILMGHARAAVCLACGIDGVSLINYPSTKTASKRNTRTPSSTRPHSPKQDTRRHARKSSNATE